MNNRIRQEDIGEILKDISKITNAINDNIDISSLHIKNRTDVLLEVLIKKNKNLFNTILKNGFPNNEHKFFLYTHHAVTTGDIYFVKKIFKHYEDYNLNIFEEDEHKNNALHIALGMTEKNKEIIDYLKSKNISMKDKNINGMTPEDLL